MVAPFPTSRLTDRLCRATRACVHDTARWIDEWSLSLGTDSFWP